VRGVCCASTNNPSAARDNLGLCAHFPHYIPNVLLGQEFSDIHDRAAIGRDGDGVANGFRRWHRILLLYYQDNTAIFNGFTQLAIFWWRAGPRFLPGGSLLAAF
jgi:hypothetical protein